jgi:hypothetical protein
MLKTIEDKVLTILEPLKGAPFNCKVQPLNLGLYGVSSATSLYFSYRDTEPSILSFNQGREDKIRFELILMLNDLRTHTRAYPILEKSRQLLEEYEPIPEITIDRFRMIQQIFRDDFLPDFWTYQQLWQISISK